MPLAMEGGACTLDDPMWLQIAWIMVTPRTLAGRSCPILVSVGVLGLTAAEGGG